jgi:hypothetical protein
MNDEAHHVHAKKRPKKGTAGDEELVWRQFMNVLFQRMRESNKDKDELFLQIDYSATPFYGSAEKREYFPHIVYDYDLLSAMQNMLVKQLFLEERQAIVKLIEGYKYEVKGTWGKLSDVPRIMVRESKSVVTDKSIYPRIGYQAKEWEYLIVSENIFKNNRGLSFEAFIPLCRSLRDNIIAKARGRLLL